MNRSCIAAIMALVGMAGCSEHRITGHSVPDRTPWELLVLLLAAVVLYLAFSGVVTLLSRKVPRTGRSLTARSFDVAAAGLQSRPARVPRHRRHREGRVDPGQGPDDTAAPDPAPRPPAP
jgi:hypothetical protein